MILRLKRKNLLKKRINHIFNNNRINNTNLINFLLRYKHIYFKNNYFNNIIIIIKMM